MRRRPILSDRVRDPGRRGAAIFHDATVNTYRIPLRLAASLLPVAALALVQSPASATDPAPAPACTAQVIPFAPGYQVVVTVRNTTASPVTGWYLGFQLATTATIGSFFGGTITRSGTAGTITPAPYYATIQPGGQANVGFGGSAVPFTPPTDFTLNGAPCATSS